eukprot:gene51-3448_t
MALDASEATQYDRQIRLWGLDAQRRIRRSRVLVFGARGLAVELCKNLVLAGIHSLTLVDDGSVQHRDLVAQFFLTENDIGCSRAETSVPHLQTLNPKVKVAWASMSMTGLTSDVLNDYDIVVVTEGSFRDAADVNQACRSCNVKFYYGICYGFYGFFFQDLHDHEYIIEKKQLDLDDETSTELLKLSFEPWTSALSHSFASDKRRSLPLLFLALRVIDELQSRGVSPNKASRDAIDDVIKDTLGSSGLSPEVLSRDYLTSVLESSRTELCTSSAIVGGVLAGEIIKAIAGKDEPLNNCFCFDGFNSSGLVYKLGAAKPSQTASQTAKEIIEL